MLRIFLEHRRFTVVEITVWLLQLAFAAIMIAGVWGTVAHGRYTWSQWFDFCVYGVTIGSVYALLALGYTMVYAVLRIINFAHGDTMMSGAFAGYFAASAFHDSGALNSYPLLAMAGIFAVSMAVAVGVALLTERIAYRPFRHARGMAPLICAIGMSFVLQQTFRGAFGSGARAYPDPAWVSGIISLGAVQVPVIDLYVTGCAVVTMGFLYLVVHHTKTGTAMRAIAEDTEIASTMGIDVNKVVTFTFILAGSTAGVAGVCYGFLFKQVSFFMGLAPGIKAFGAAVLGGVGSIPGAVFGGLLLGVFESLGPAVFLDGIGVDAPYQLRDLVAYLLLIVVLVFRPQGIFADRLGRKRA